jgi:hypothetical protein
MGERKIWRSLADAFCSHGFCGGDQTSAPCEKARLLADIAMDALTASPNLSEYVLEKLESGDYTACDGYCNDD